jgi:arsenate reductase-like glutaredoxin family protein
MEENKQTKDEFEEWLTKHFEKFNERFNKKCEEYEEHTKENRRLMEELKSALILLEKNIKEGKFRPRRPYIIHPEIF